MTVDVEKIAVGGLCKEGGCMNYCRPQLIDFGRRAAIVCGKDIRIIDVAAGITDYVFAHHKSKVVGLASHLGSLYSCDDKSRIIVWDIDGRNVTIKKNLHFPVPALGVVEQLAHVYKNGSVAAVICFPSGERQLMMTDLENKFEQRDVLINNISPGANSFSFSKERDFCVGITYQGKYSAFEVVPTDRANVQNKSLLREHERKRRFLAQKRTFTCVAAHPSEKTVAAGDNYGGVEVYYNIFDSHYRTSRRLHLHGLAASDIAFSIDGSELYSCSLQGVLMRWSLRQGNLRQKQPLPQLNAPMTLLSIEGASLLATHTDNSFSLVDLVEYKLKNLFFGLGVSLSVREQISSPGQLALGTARDLKPDSVILSYDPRTQAVVTKSRPGHLHFYSSETKQQLFMVDVVSENFRMDAVTYRDVTHVTFSRDGCLMATVDCAEDNPHSQQLKFWLFDHQNQSWRMDTSVLCPHSARIRGCALQPQLCSTASSDLPLCLTFCEAGDIKLWGARLNDGVSQWACVSSGGCWDGSSVAQCGVWSWCGTLIAVAHQRLVSVWRPDPLKRCFALSHEQLQEPLTDMCFSWLPGGGACVVECRPSAVSSWCLRSRQLLYMAPLAALAMAYDPNTALLAVATHDNQVILYHGGELVPLRLYDIGSSAAFRLLFLPAASTPLLSSYTRLFFFTFSLELMSFPIYTCDKDLASSELLCPHPQEQEERPTLGLSLLLAEKTSVDAPAQNLFSFRVADGSAALRQTCIVEDFEDSCDVMSQLSKLVLDFGKKTELTATGAAR